MATEQNLISEEDKKKQQQSSSVAPQSSPMLAGSGPAKTAGSGRFTNISKYLGANQGAGEQLAQKVGSQIQQQGQQVQGAIGQQTAGVQANIQNEQNRLNQASTIGTQLANDASKVDVATAKSLMSGQVNQPDTAKFMQAGTGVQGLQDTASLAGSQSGRAQLLRDAFRRPTYTSGQSSLDSALLNTSSAVRGLQRSADQNVQAAQKGLTQGQEMIAKANPALASQALEAQKLLTNTVGEQFKTQTGAAQSSAEAINAQNKAMYDYVTGGKFMKDLSSPTVRAMPVIPGAEDQVVQSKMSGQPIGQEAKSQLAQAKEMLAKSGVDLSQNLYGLRPQDIQALMSQSLKQMDAVSAEQAASPEARARLNVLAQLSNVDPSKYDPNAAGYDPNAAKFGFDKKNYQSAVDLAKKEAEAKFNATKAGLDLNQFATELYRPEQKNPLLANQPYDWRGMQDMQKRFSNLTMKDLAGLADVKGDVNARQELIQSLVDAGKLGKDQAAKLDMDREMRTSTDKYERGVGGTAKFVGKTPDEIKMYTDMLKKYQDAYTKRQNELGFNKSLENWNLNTQPSYKTLPSKK